MNNIKPFKDQKLTYSSDGRLLDEYGNAVMMDWETPIMKKSARIVSRNGGKVLNVGFGMGIIDSFIEQEDVEEHWIIELHKDVYRKMLEDKWHLKPKVKIMFGDWREYMSFLPKFDGVFFDTHADSFNEFHSQVYRILNDNGIYSFFNNPMDDEDNLHITKGEYESIKDWGNINFEELPLEFIDSHERQRKDGLLYWFSEWKTYYCPIVTKKQIPNYNF
jgi:protein arginine N-methyltransferase 2